MRKALETVVAFLVVLDVWANEKLLNGWRGETISSRCGKAMLRRANGTEEPGDARLIFWGKMINRLFFWEANHCVDKVQVDVGRM